jgi:hypothetical protein
MAGWDDDYLDYERDAAITELIEESLKSISVDNAKHYLGTYGDAVEARVNSCLRQARELHRLTYFGAAVVLASTATELIVRFMLVRPLVQGAFLTDEWAAILAGRIVNGHTAEDRKLLPTVLRQWSVDLEKIRLTSSAPVWPAFVNTVWPMRNKIVHHATEAADHDAVLAIECADALLTKVVRNVAKNLGFTLDTTGKWAEIRGEAGTIGEEGYRQWSQSFDPKSPFNSA